MTTPTNKCNVCGERAVLTFCRRCGYRPRPLGIDPLAPVTFKDALAAFYAAAPMEVAGSTVPPVDANGRPPLVLPRATPQPRLFVIGRLGFGWYRNSPVGDQRRPWSTTLDWNPLDSYDSVMLINEGGADQRSRCPIRSGSSPG